MATRLSDEILRQIAKSTSKPYSHEGRAMAEEILEWRRKAAEAAANALTTSPPIHGGPPWGLSPPGKP